MEIMISIRRVLTFLGESSLGISLVSADIGRRITRYTASIAEMFQDV